jgi:hypothetical protein
MRWVHFVSLAEDGGSAVVQTEDGQERFALALDAGLRGAVQSWTPPVPPASFLPGPAAPPPQDEPAPAPALVAADPIGPREIQVRVRAGESPEQVAAACGMPLERVMRFAAPVVEERHRIAGEARRARARRSGSDADENRFVVFGEAVDDRFGAHGIAADSVAWDARRREDGEWIVIASWLGGLDSHSAEWLFSRSSRSVTPLDDTATDLLSDKPIRPVAPPPPVRPSLVAAPPLVPGVVAFPPMPDAHTAPVPVIDEVFDQEAPPEEPRTVPPLVPAGMPLDYDAPPLPLGITEPAPRPGGLRNLGVSRRDESEEERAARARIPSWDDILLGIRRKD